jgi:predicted DNA-binding transcriptional regulator AlpA
MPDFSIPDRLADDAVVDYVTAARVAGLSLCTLRRLVARGEGPPVVRLSPRRVGVRACDLRAWIAARTARPAA